MQGIYLLNYRVKGVKSLDKEVELSFYKKTIRRPLGFSDYNAKGIYGMNGSGKSAIISSVEILKNILLKEDYLSNSIVQRKLKELINKSSHECSIGVDFLVSTADKSRLLIIKYELTIAENEQGRFNITRELLAQNKSVGVASDYDEIIVIEHGSIIKAAIINDAVNERIVEETKNLLARASFCPLIARCTANIAKEQEAQWSRESVIRDVVSLYAFATSLTVYLDEEDKHTDYVINNIVEEIGPLKEDNSLLLDFLKEAYNYNKVSFNGLGSGDIVVFKQEYDNFRQTIGQLEVFLKVFKPELERIDIDKKNDREYYRCRLVLKYRAYSVDAEFESTGIKKIIRLFSSLYDMYNGGIVFIDEIDSNIHDVYLCAIIEFLSKYGSGQLCFTSHNIGPMDILKSKKKSIEFLSANHKITSWKTNGNYSPASLYRKGMVEGSPFNVEAMDFIGVFDSREV